MSEKLMVLNVRKGGYDSYKATADQTPEREQAIKDLIASQREQGVNTIVLSDTFLWRERYDDPESKHIEAPGIAQHLGYRVAFHTAIGDPKLRALGREEVGLTVATNLPTHYSEFVSPVGSQERTRNALVMHLGHFGQGFDLGAVYLSEDNLAARHSQATDLDYVMNGSGPKVSSRPSIIAGDLNTLRPHDQYERASQRLVSSFIHLGAKAVGEIDFGDGSWLAKKFRYVADSLRTQDDRRVIQYMKWRGYHDLDAGPTYPSSFPVVDPDHILHRGVQILDSYTVGGKEVSDHKGIVVEFRVPLLDK